MRLGPLVAVCVLACSACSGNVSGETGAGDDDPPLYTPPYDSCSGNDTSAPPSGSLCLEDPTAPTTDPPLAVIEHQLVTYKNVPAVHVRVVFDPKFVDNTYGTTKIGYRKGHNFGDLLESDHARIKMLDKQGNLILDFNHDYISEDPAAPCGYSSLGVDGGDGGMLVGDRSAILGYTSSLDRNLNERGYCSFIDNSPATDEACSPNAAAPDWDFRVVYEVWVALSAFEPNGFGSAYMNFVHASPSKYAERTVYVEPGECPCIEIDINTCVPPGGGDQTPPGGGCSSNHDCPSEQFCYDNACVPIIL
jgi:hypothetical protein